MCPESDGGGRFVPHSRPPSRPHPGEELGFKTKDMVLWLNPLLLLRAGWGVVISGLFAGFSDKRELASGLPTDLRTGSSARDEDTPPYTHPANRDAAGNLWLDYTADVGEGFDSTYTVAWVLSRPTLQVPGKTAEHQTSRGRLLILGGDQVYPSASWDAYRDRFVGPYQAALPYLAPDTAPHLFAIPGNHDWYDGLTSFMRLFCQGNWIGAWKTRQQRSYVALQLSDRWWLWATDIQFDTYIDGPQLDYFRAAGDELEKGHQVILATAKPSWVDGGSTPPTLINEQGSWQTLSFLEEKVIAPTGARVSVTISGDKHHYARYTQSSTATQPQERITAGGGGAHTSATHYLPDGLTLHGVTGTSTHYEVRGISPTRGESQKMRKKAIRAIIGKTGRGLGLVIGAIWGLIALSMADAIKDGNANLTGELDAGAFTLIPDAAGVASVLLLLALLFVLFLFADARTVPNGKRRKHKKAAMGLLHWLAHIVPAIAITLIALKALNEWIPSWADQGLRLGWIAAVVLLLAGFILGRLIFALYLRLANGNDGRQHATEIFGGLASTRYKNFLRLKIDRDEKLTIYPIGIRDCPEWQLRDDDAPDAEPWFVPAAGHTDPEPELLEAPITIDPTR